jgi:hypothetical protein
MSNTKRAFSDESKKFRSLSKEDKYNKVLEFCRTYKRTPKVTKVPESERVMGQFLINSKSAINRGGVDEWEIKKVSEISKFSYSRETRIQKIQRIIEFCKDNNKTPSQSSRDITEKKLGQLLNTIKNLEKKKQLTENELIEFNKILPYRNNYQRSKEEKLIDVLNFCKKYNRTPKQHVDNKEEKRLAEFLSTTKLAFKSNKLDTSCTTLMVDIMKYAPMNREEKLKTILEFAEKNKHSPKINSDDITERQLAVFLTKINILHRNNSLKQSELDILMKIRSICNIKTRKEKLEELLEYTTEHNRLPRLNSDDYYERKMAMFYNNIHQSVKKNKLSMNELNIFKKIRSYSQKSSPVEK